MATMTRNSLIKICTLLFVGAALGGCAQAPKTIYHWEGFQRQLYDHFKADSSSPEDQLRILNMQAEKARAGGEALPPGFRAHLALIYLRLGRDQEARVQLEAEKNNFPESSQYMDFLLKRMTAPKS